MDHGKKAALVALAMGMTACGSSDDGGSGGLSLSLSGEEAAEIGFPVPGTEELRFADGWSVRFDKYLVGLGNVRVGSDDGEEAVRDGEAVVADLTAGEQAAFHFDDLPARRWDRFGYDLLVPTAGARAIGDVAAADVERMIDGGYNYWIEGRAEKDGTTLEFAWGLPAPTRNDGCINSADDSPGVVVRNNATAAYQITLHLDHLFYDRLGAHEGVKMRFEAIAAAADQGRIAWESLAGQTLSRLVGTDGEVLRDEAGARLVYDPGSVPLAPQNLQEYLLAASRSQGRFNGEGTCVNSSID